MNINFLLPKSYRISRQLKRNENMQSILKEIDRKAQLGKRLCQEQYPDQTWAEPWIEGITITETKLIRRLHILFYGDDFVPFTASISGSQVSYILWNFIKKKVLA